MTSLPASHPAAVALRCAAPGALAFARWTDARTAPLRALLDAIPVPLILLSSERRVVAANLTADDDLASCLAVHEGRVTRFAHRASDSFDTAFRRAQWGHGSTVATWDPGTAGVMKLRLAPLVASEWLNTAYAQATVVLSLDPGRPGMAAAGRLFDLTPQELRVLTLLAAGLAPREAALQLGVAVSTIRSHMRGLFQKTYTSRQAELLRLIAPLA